MTAFIANIIQQRDRLRTSFGVDEEISCLFFSGNVEEIQAFMQYVQELSILSK